MLPASRRSGEMLSGVLVIFCGHRESHSVGRLLLQLYSSSTMAVSRGQSRVDCMQKWSMTPASMGVVSCQPFQGRLKLRIECQGVGVRLTEALLFNLTSTYLV